MKKKITALFLFLCLCAFLLLPCFATPPRLVDEANLLTEAERQQLTDQLNEISERQQFDIVIVTVDSLDGKTPMAYADDFYDYNGYGFGEGKDGCLLLLNMSDRDWWISTSGFGITAITDAGRSAMADLFLPSLSGGEYASGFSMFAQLCDEFVTQAKAGTPYDVGNLPEQAAETKKPQWFKWIGYSLLIGLLGAFLPVNSMKGKLKSVRSRNEAQEYVRNGSMQLDVQRDTFLYASVSRVKRQSNNGGSSTHTSSSGSTHGGGGGKF